MREEVATRVLKYNDFYKGCLERVTDRLSLYARNGIVVATGRRRKESRKGKMGKYELVGYL